MIRIVLLLCFVASVAFASRGIDSKPTTSAGCPCGNACLCVDCQCGL